MWHLSALLFVDGYGRYRRYLLPHYPTPPTQSAATQSVSESPPALTVSAPATSCMHSGHGLVPRLTPDASSLIRCPPRRWLAYEAYPNSYLKLTRHPAAVFVATTSITTSLSVFPPPLRRPRRR